MRYVCTGHALPFTVLTHARREVHALPGGREACAARACLSSCAGFDMEQRTLRRMGPFERVRAVVLRA
jgi:hypothetical protein